MNAKHPIDELFARGLRDAEATPPPGAWEGISRVRQRAKQGRRRRVGFFALLVLVILGTAAYLFRSGTRLSPSEGATTVQPENRTAGGGIRKGPHASVQNTASDNDALTSDDKGSVAQPTGPNSTRHSAPRSNKLLPEQHSSTQQSTAIQQSWPSDGVMNDPFLVSAEQQMDAEPASAVNEDDNSDRREQGGIAAEKDSGRLSLRSLGADDAMDDFARRLPLRSAVLIQDSLVKSATPAAQQATYVLAKGATWVGLLASWSDPATRWNGGSEEMATLNRSESWSAQTGLGVVLGRTWQSGWFGELGARYTRISSNLFYTERTPASTQTITDTTWTATQADQLTIYTWNIVTNYMEDPGDEVRFDAQNRYDVLRFAPALGYSKQWRRLNLAVRAGPVLTLFLARTGKTLTVVDNPEPGASRLALMALDDGALDDRFRPQWGFSCGLDLGYTINERWSISAGPSRSITLTERPSSLGGDGWAANLRLIYEFRPHERRVR